MNKLMTYVIHPFRSPIIARLLLWIIIIVVLCKGTYEVMLWSQANRFKELIAQDCEVVVDVTREQISSMDELPVFGGNYIIDGKRLSATCRVPRGEWVCECTWRD